MKNKKKRLHSNLVRFLAQILEETHRTCPLYDQTLCPTCNGRAMLQFCLLFYAILQSWRPKGGAMAQCPPPKYAPDNNIRFGAKCSPDCCRIANASGLGCVSVPQKFRVPRNTLLWRWACYYTVLLAAHELYYGRWPHSQQFIFLCPTKC